MVSFPQTFFRDTRPPPQKKTKNEQDQPQLILAITHHPRFTFLHPEKVPSAIERYANEIKRVLGVLEGVLATKAESQWLIGDRITFADLAFVPWNDRLDITLGVPKDEVFEGFPHVAAWHDCMTKRPSWIKAMQIRTRLLDEQGFGSNGMPKGLKQSQNHEGSDVAADKS